MTGLGIVFGVAAVISMLAIGKGAQQEILEQIKMVGVNNIMITPIVTPGGGEDESDETGGKQKSKFSPGLHLKDVDAIREVLPTINKLSPEIALNSYVVQNGKRSTAKLLGVSREYFDIFNLYLSGGMTFNDYQEENGIPVCVVGANIAQTFFSGENPVGKYIKFDKVWLRVIGVLERNNVKITGFENTGINVMNDNIYVPVKTMLLRFQNRALISTKVQTTSGRFGGYFFTTSVNPNQNTQTNYHQLDRIIVQVTDSEELDPSTKLLSRLLLRRHQDVEDFEITVPELLLKQEQRTKDIFNIVLGAIASISLLVGGI